MWSERKLIASTKFDHLQLTARQKNNLDSNTITDPYASKIFCMDLLSRRIPPLFVKHVKIRLCSIVGVPSLSCRMSTSAGASTNPITTPPAPGQHILHNGKEYTTIKEGLAYILIPASASTVPQTTPKGENESQSVFYNPIQQFNRDLSVLAIKAYGKEAIERKSGDSSRWTVKRGKKRKRGENNGESSEPGKAARLETGDEAEELSNIPVIDNSTGVEATPTGIPITLENSHDGDKVVEQVAREQSVVDDAALESSREPEVSAGAGAVVMDTTGDTAQDIATAKSRQPTFTILDALSATGLRALRYVQEIPFTTSVTANDLLPAATETINLNIEHNKLTGKIVSTTGNALTHMYSLVGDGTDHKGRPKPSKKYDVIDLDPYGTAAPFLDAAVQSVRDDGGLLCVTCTDAGVWASNGYPEKAYSLYGGMPIKGLHSHEGGLRLILHAIATSAARYGLAIEPLLSLSIDFYARVFVRIRKSPADVKFLAGKTMVVYNCDSGCGAWNTQLLAKNKLAPNKSGKGTFYKHVFALAPSAGEYCEHCGTKTHMAGPMYAGPLHSPAFIRRILDDLPKVSKETYATTDRIEGMLNLALDEMLLPLDTQTAPGLDAPPPGNNAKEDPAALDHYPFFFIPSVLSKVIHCVTPHENAMRGALRHLGYRVTRSHTKPGTIKTDAPWSVIWEVMREWVRQKAPVREGAVKEGMPGWKILGLDKAGEVKGKVLSKGTTMDSKDSEKGADIPENLNGNVNGDKPEIVFDEALGKERDAKKLVRYQQNPRENWGPMNRARGY
jgi:tRNA (guanine26-N2/guanine27-N2)-dimethyltransferase